MFEKITRISTRYFFMYNDYMFFCVPKNMISISIGPDARNVKRLSEIFRKKIRIIPVPKGLEHAKQFIEAIVNPIQFKGIEITESEIILNAGSQSKASLIGRNKRRLLEMQKIIKDYFGKEFRIV